MGEVWAGVVRVSFVGDRSGDSFHADQEQVDAINRYAAKHGARVEFMPPELSVSGGKPINERPSLSAAIEGVEAGTYTGVVVAYLSRLTRSRSGIQIWERVEAAGGHVHCAAEDLDTSTPNGRFIRDIHLANAVREREEHTDRFELRRQLATEAGVWQRRQVPSGYVKDPDTRKLVPAEDAAKIKNAFLSALNGVPVVQIADMLGMTPNGLRGLLRNRVYLGELRVGKHVNPTAHPPLVSVDLFDAVQAKRPRPSRARTRHAGPALLAGIVRCQGCGHVMTRGGNSRQVTYVCLKRASHGHCKAPAAINAERLDEHVTALVLPEIDRMLVTESESAASLDQAIERQRAAEEELASYLEKVSALDVDASALHAAASKRQAAVDDARAEVRRIQSTRPAMAGVSSGREAWNALDAHGRNALLRALLEVVVVKRAGRGVVMPLVERVRVVKFGAGFPVPVKRGDAPMPLVELPFPDLDSEGVLREPGVQ